MVQRDSDLADTDIEQCVWLPSLCARLLTLFYDNASQVEEYVQQLAVLLLSDQEPCEPLEVAVLQMASRSLHFALLMYWTLASAVEDLTGSSAAPLFPDEGRAGRLLLSLYGVIEQRGKGPVRHATPAHCLMQISIRIRIPFQFHDRPHWGEGQATSKGKGRSRATVHVFPTRTAPGRRP